MLGPPAPPIRQANGRPRLLRAATLCLLALCGFSGGVPAEPNFNDPAFRPQGARIGNWSLASSLALGQEHNDNVFAAPQQAQSDGLLTFSPSLRIESLWKRHALGLDLAYLAGRYGEALSDNFNDYRAKATGRLDIGASGTLKLSGGVERLHEPRESAEAQLDSTPTTDEKRALSIAYRQRLGRNFVELGTASETHDYTDSLSNGVVINQDDRDRSVERVTLDIGREHDVDSSVYVRVATERVDYAQATDDAGYRRDNDALLYGVGLTHHASPVLRIDAFAGSENRKYADDRFAEAQALIYSGQVAWSFTRLSTLRLELARAVLDTALFGAAGVDENRAGIALDHELLRNLILSASYTRIQDDYRENPRRDTIDILRLEADYAMNRNLSLSLDLIETRRETAGTAENNDYRQQRVGLGVTLSY